MLSFFVVEQLNVGADIIRPVKNGLADDIRPYAKGGYCVETDAQAEASPLEQVTRPMQAQIRYLVVKINN